LNIAGPGIPRLLLAAPGMRRALVLVGVALLAALQHLRTRPFVDGQRIGVMGSRTAPWPRCV
jgi:hypothetical protein